MPVRSPPIRGRETSRVLDQPRDSSQAGQTPVIEGERPSAGSHAHAAARRTLLAPFHPLSAPGDTPWQPSRVQYRPMANQATAPAQRAILRYSALMAG